MTRKLSALAMAAWVALPGTVQAAEPQPGPTPVEVKVELGTKSDALRFDVDTEAPQEKLDQLLKLTERYCVVYQTIKSGPPIEVKLERA